MVLGIDVGGTNIKFGVVDEEFNILESYSIVTEKDNGDIHLIQTIINKAKEIRKKFDYSKIGIGTPGTIDEEKGIVIRASNLPYSNTNVVGMMEEELSVPVKISNDATCAVTGELYAGVGKMYNNFIMITLGTGVGGGIVVGNKIYKGTSGRAGEIGHMIEKYDGIKCPCGQRGCYEQYASVNALIRQTEKAIHENSESILADIGKSEVTGRTAFDAMKKECPVAVAVIDKYTDYIVTGVQSLIRIFQPDSVVFGGAISNEGDNLLIPIKEKVTLPVNIHISELKNNAGIIGAAALATQI